MEIRLKRTEKSNLGLLPQDPTELGFGKFFTDHMFLMDYNSAKGWHDPRIEPFHKLELSPSAMVLHYGQQVFEGLKAYRGAHNEVYLFRPEYNWKRLNRSCQRMVIPQIDPAIIDQGLRKLIEIDQNWIPTAEGCALYIRPIVIATDPFLGVRPSDTYLFYIITGPVGAYYPEGFNPISIYVGDKYVRAVAGGTGEAKTSGNYAGSLAAQKEARLAGYSQVLWLDAKERKFVEEVGTMNIFFRINDTLITSPLTGSILPGNTRDAVIAIAKSWGIRVIERKISIDEIVEANHNQTLKEVFGCGTAAIIAPVKKFFYQENDYQVSDGKTGELAGRLYKHILDLQYGRIEDPYGWRVRVL